MVNDMPCGGDAYSRFDTSLEANPSCGNCWHLATEGDPLFRVGVTDPMLYGKCLSPAGYEHARAAGITLTSVPPR